MRMRTLLYITGAALIGAIGFGLATTSSKTAQFTPRENQEATAEHSGAVEIDRMMRANIETGEINEADYLRLEDAVKKYIRANGNEKADPVSWDELGPDDVGGRTRALLVIEETTIITGGVSGGLWKSTDFGNTWSQVTTFPNQMIGAIAQAGNGDIYVGTGSSFDGAGGEGGSGFRGRGIFRSTDGGDNWAALASIDPGVLGNGDWTAVNALVADPNNANRIYVGADAGFGYIEGDVVTMGANGIPDGTIQDITVAMDGSYMLVSAGSARIYRSTGSDFSNFEGEFGSGDANLPQSGVGRARVRIAPTDPNSAFVLYCNTGGLFGGLYHSNDAGQTWSEVWPSDAQDNILPRGQGFYDLALGIPPYNPELAYVGGIEFWRSGPNYQAELAALPFDIEGLDIDMHVDMHEVVFSPAGVMWVTCDGGIYRSEDDGETYIECNFGYNVTQYYGIAYSAGAAVTGGTQDNGTHLIPNDGTFPSDMSSFEISGGDGFDCAISQVTDAVTGIVFTTSQYGVLYRFSEEGAGGQFYDDDLIDAIDDDGEIGPFYTCMRLYEDTEDDNSRQSIILVNPYTETVTDSTFQMETAAQNLPFEWTLGDNTDGENGVSIDTLRYWDELVRPAVTLDEPLTEDVLYFWLDPQDLTETILTCDTTFNEIGTETVIEAINPVDSCFYFEPLDSTICITIGFDTTYTEQTVFEEIIDCTTQYFYEADTLYEVREQLNIQDPYTSMTTIGFTGGEGVWMTRDGTNFNTQPNWWKLCNAPTGGGTHAIEYAVGDHEAAGDVMYIGGWNNKLYRLSGLGGLWTDEQAVDTLNNITGEATADFDGDGIPDGDGTIDILEYVEIESGNSALTGVAVDPNDPAHVVITFGGYGNSSEGKVRETFNALADPADIEWESIWENMGELSNMPIYDAVIDVIDPTGSTILIGTEYGVWRTDDNGDEWTISNEGMVTQFDEFAAPVFDMKQQWRSGTRWSYPLNNGRIYAGTHGRGIWSNGDSEFVNVEENGDLDGDGLGLLVYPNPVTTGLAQIKLSLAAAGDVNINIYNIKGQLVKTINHNQLATGTHILQINAADLSNGNYVLSVDMGSRSEVARFVVMK
jgi:hypothetical protein